MTTELATTSMWHPLASMSAVVGDELIIERGEGCYVWDVGGRRFLDATASLWYCQIGHGRLEMADAIGAQLRRLETYHTFQRFANPPALELADRLAAIAPLGDGAKVMFGSGGSDAVEAACKLARLYWTARGQPDKQIVVARERSYHGLHGFGTSVGGLVRNRRGFGRLIEDVVRVETMSATALEAAIAEWGADKIAAFICEPIVAGAGIIFPPDEYLLEVERLCRANSLLLIVDEVVTGFGRAGAWFASERYGIRPDLLVFAKGATSGYLPLGGMVASAAVAEPFWSTRSDRSFRHGVTFAGHASACVAALTNMEILEREELIERSRALEAQLARVLEACRGHGGVIDVRTGAGLIGGVQLADAARADAVIDRCLERGVIVRAVGDDDTIQVSPPLIVTEAELEMIGEVICAAVQSL